MRVSEGARVRFKETGALGRVVRVDRALLWVVWGDGQIPYMVTENMVEVVSDAV